MNTRESLFTLARHLAIIIVIMNHVMTNFNVATDNVAGSHMPLRSDWTWTVLNPFNLMPAFILAMLVLGALNKLI